MHFLDAAREAFTCIPVIHEVSAGIAVEYFNETTRDGKAFALVTAGPGITNMVTAVAGAHTESRELLILGGQVKTEDLARGEVRQRGIQEVDGVSILQPLCKIAVRLEEPIERSKFNELVLAGSSGKPGPVFIELCLDVQGAPPTREEVRLHTNARPTRPTATSAAIKDVRDLLATAQRPVLLIGGGLDYDEAVALNGQLVLSGLPVATTYNGSDRFDASSPTYFGRPNTWGMRWSNVLLQQADVIIAVGTRLGLQQTGFNWREFGPSARVVQVDIDERELSKGHPNVHIPVLGDAASFLSSLLHELLDNPIPPTTRRHWQSWLEFGQRVRGLLPLDDPRNSEHPGFWNPYDFVLQLGALASHHDVVIPCSSGGAFTATYQALLPKLGQRILSNKSLASMGYGLAGAIGAAIARPDAKVLHLEGDGGFAQNLQELGTVTAQGLNIKTFLWVNEGYASIRMTQRNYFNGAWIGCDKNTGVGFPNWSVLFNAYSIPCTELDAMVPLESQLGPVLDQPGPHAFLVPIHPEQTFYPKITSRVTKTGSMESNPLHLMSPDLPADVARHVLYFAEEV